MTATGRPRTPVGRATRGVVDYTLTDRQRAAVARLEQLADFIVAELDRIYGDPDTEPSLGAINAHNQCRWSEGASDDREQDDEREPSLGSIGSNAANQERWAGGDTLDHEDEHDGREPVSEDEGAACEDEGSVFDEEPSLGWASQEGLGPRLGVGTLADQEAARQLMREASFVGDELL